MPRPLSSPGRNVIAATARSSSGDIFRLETLAQKITVWKEHGLLFTYIPAGYPNTFKYVDVTVKDPQLRTARWRITDLTRMLN